MLEKVNPTSFVCYEIENRPEWVRIPLRGLIAALEVLP